MKQWLSLLLVVSFAAGSLGMVGWMMQTPVQQVRAGAKQDAAPPAVAPAPETTATAATAESPAITPDLSRVDAFALLDPVPAGQAAPDIDATDALGRRVRLSSFKGKKNAVLVFYQGSFCTVCGHQLENIQKHLQAFAQQDAEVLAISADQAAEAQKTLGEHGLSFHIIPDDKKIIIRHYGVANVSKHGIAWPSAFIVDKKGVVRFTSADRNGRRLHSDTLLKELSKITGKPAPALGYEE
jgi:peroxiredoxin Q/BCP